MPHILIAGKLHDDGLALVEAAPGITYDYVPDANPRAYLPYLPKAEGLVLRTQPLTAQDIATAPKLGIVSRHGVGYDAVDVPALDALNIPLAIVGDVNSRTVAEHAMALMLACSREIVKSNIRFRGGDWAQRNAFSPREVDGKTLLIVGFGRIGRRLADLARAFNMKVLVHDPFLRDAPPAGIERVEALADALPRAQFVSLHVPRSDGALIGAAELALMPPGAIVINTARGELIDEAALLSALNEGRIAAAGLDVLSEEPPAPDNPLIAHENTVVTPHAAGLTQECAARMARVSVQNVLDHFNGTLDPTLVVNLKGQSETC